MGCPVSSLVLVICHPSRRNRGIPVSLHPPLYAEKLQFPLVWLEMRPSCEGGNGIQVPWIASNCSHCLKVPRREGNVLLKGQKLAEVKPGHCTRSPVCEQQWFGMEVRCCCIGCCPF